MAGFNVPFSTLSLVLFVGCAAPLEDRSDLLPDDRLMINLPMDFGATARTSVGDTAEYYQVTAQLTLDVNTVVGEALAAVDHITSFAPTWSSETDDLVLWGPWEDAGVHGRLWMQGHEDGSHTWAIEAKQVSEPDESFVAVFAGEIEPGADEVHSAGRFAMDFTALASFEADPEVTQGEFFVIYSLSADSMEATAGFANIVDDEAQEGSAVVTYGQEHGLGGWMDLILAADATGNDVPESHIVRTRWEGTGAGRADAYLTGGDLGELVYSATECWDPAHDVVFYEENYTMTQNGEMGLCVFDEPEWNDASV